MRNSLRFVVAVVVLLAGCANQPPTSASNDLPTLQSNRAGTTSFESAHSATQEGVDRSVVLCHVPSDGSPAVTIQVNLHAVAAHLNHGDILGVCAQDGGDGAPDEPNDDDTEPDPPVAGQGLFCDVVDAILTCTASGLEAGVYVALNIDLQNCNGGDYGVCGISEGLVGADGSVTFVVDLAHTARFDFGPPPAECSGPHDVMVAYGDGIAVYATEIIVPAFAN